MSEVLGGCPSGNLDCGQEAVTPDEEGIGTDHERPQQSDDEKIAWILEQARDVFGAGVCVAREQDEGVDD